MNDALSAVLGAAPQLGGGGIFVVVLTLLIRREAQASAQWAAEREALREQLDELTERIDVERSRRWAVEDARYAPATDHRRRSRTEGTPSWPAT